MHTLPAMAAQPEASPHRALTRLAKLPTRFHQRTREDGGTPLAMKKTKVQFHIFRNYCIFRK